MDERSLEEKLFPPSKPARIRRPLPDWATVHQELRRKGMTLALLWHEYKTEYPEGLQYSWFCEQYRGWARHLDVAMRQEHRAGEKLFVDYAGHTIPVINRETGELREAQVFVAVLGASNFTFAEATWTQTLPDWCASHARALRFFGGAPELLVPDNLRSAVSKPHRYEPDTNPTYQDFAEHYGMAILPARVRHPRDKSKVEVGVQIVERWILLALRHRTFFSLAALNTAIAELLQRLNDRPFKKLSGSRHSLFESLDRPALKPLPAEPYVYAEWKKVRVHIDYHVEVGRHYYSVPFSLVGKQLHARFEPRAPSSSSIAARVSPAMSAPTSQVVTPLSPNTCPRNIDAWVNGHPIASSSGPRNPVPLPQSSSPMSFAHDVIPSRAIAPA
jgi:transposase